MYRRRVKAWRDDEGEPVGERLEGKVCIVTGAAQGIGAAYARALAGEGADVAIIDLKRIDQMAAIGKQVVAELGHVDVLVNNAGLMFDQLTATWDDFAGTWIGSV
jgi:NAD(P)-dependent dehydrogenase (short-subunit alcohol dehydrogenase family)